MAELIIVTGGKGGVGKSTVCAGLAIALTRAEKRVLILETGQRCLDVLMRRDDVVYDFSDVVEERCTLDDAVLQSNDVDFICSPTTGFSDENAFDSNTLYAILAPLEYRYDYILAEVPMQTTLLEAFGELAERALLVTLPDRASARGARTVSDLLAKKGVWDIRLCVNALSPDFVKKRPVPDIDWLIDTICAQLICIIPFTQELFSGAVIGDSVKPFKTAGIIFDNFAQRIIGRYIDLLVR